MLLEKLKGSFSSPFWHNLAKKRRAKKTTTATTKYFKVFITLHFQTKDLKNSKKYLKKGKASSGPNFPLTLLNGDLIGFSAMDKQISSVNELSQA